MVVAGTAARAPARSPDRSVASRRWLRGGCVLCGAGSAGLCPRCLGDAPPPPVGPTVADPVWALFAYDGRGAEIVQALKFGDGRRAVGPLAQRLATRLLERLAVDLADEPVLTWVPTSAARRRARGFDQAELLARATARRLDLSARGLLVRRPSPAQTGRSRAERAAVAFRVRRRPAAPVVLVDDVCTTGATLRSASVALAEHDVAVVGRIVVAKTP